MFLLFLDINSIYIKGGDDSSSKFFSRLQRDWALPGF